MKKVYSSFVMLLISVISFAQLPKLVQNQPVEIPQIKKYVTPDFNDDDYSWGETSRGAGCRDTSYYPLTKQSSVSLTAPFAQYNDINNVEGYSQTYYYSGSGRVLGFMVFAVTDFFNTPGDAADVVCTAGVYNTSGNMPATSISTESVTISDVGFTFQSVMFSSPVSVTDNFAIGLYVTPASVDSFAVVHTGDGDGQGEDLSYVKYMGSQLSVYNDIAIDADFYMFPIMEHDISAYFEYSLTGCTEFTSNNMSQINKDYMFNAGLQQGAPALFWNFADGNWSTDYNVVHDYNQPSDYTVSLTVNYYGYSNTCVETWTEQLDFLTVNVTSTDATCGGSDGTATAIVSGGVTQYNYSWYDLSGNFLGTTQTVSGLSAGGALVTVTDNLGCTTDGGIGISNAGAPAITITTGNESCFNMGDGFVNVAATGGAMPYTYTWTKLDNGSIVGTDPMVTGLSQGVYVISLVDNLGCVAIDGAYVGNPQPVSVNINGNDVSTAGGSDGSATAYPQGGTWSGYTYMWSNQSTDQMINGLVADVYSVTVMDANNCIGISSVTINEPICDAKIEFWYQQACNGDPILNETWVWATNGNFPFTYEWSNGLTDDYVTGLAPGFYNITGTDNTGCTDVVTVEVKNIPLAVTLTSNPENCGRQDGEIFANVEGGNEGGYSLQWDNGDWGDHIGGLDGGTYVVTVSDWANCTITDMISVTGSDPMYLDVTATEATCGANDAVVSVSVTGGVPPLSYFWGDLQGNSLGTTQTISGLGGGAAALVTVVDNNGCSEWDGTPIQNIGAPSVSVTTVSVTGCNGDATGQATATATGGTSPYSYNWINFFEPGISLGTTQTITGLPTGFYIVTVTDSQVPVCAAIGVSELDEPSEVYMNVYVNDVTYPGGSDGEGWESGTWGGTSPYTYTWDNGSTDNYTTGLMAGVHEVTVADNNSCEYTFTYTVNEPTCNMSITANNVGDVDCFGGSNGSVNVNIMGGSGPYNYYWNVAGNGSIISGLTAGMYTLTVTDKFNCAATESFSVNEPSALMISSSTTDELPAGNNNGSASITVTGGTMPYEYYWSNNETTSQINGLSGGLYSVTVADNNGCLISDDVSVTAVSVTCDVSVTVTGYDEDCGHQDGYAKVDAVTGGTPPYSYNWNNGDSQFSTNNLDVGVYSVTVVDQNLCEVSTTVSVGGQQESLDFDVTVTEPSCGAKDGTAMAINITGGTSSGTYTYSWKDLSGNSLGTTATITGVGGGALLMTISDGTCTREGGMGVAEVGAPSITVTSTDLLCNGDTDASMMVAAFGGTAPYTYSWGIYNIQTNVISPLSETSATLTNVGGLPENQVYLVTVSGSDGCSALEGGSPYEPDALTLTPSSTSVTTNGGSDGMATVDAMGGNNPYTYSWSNGGNTQSINNVTAGLYTVTVTDNNGCSDKISVVVDQPGGVTITCNVSVTLSATDVSIQGGNDGEVIATVSGDQGVVSYNWSNSGSGNTISNLVAGVYSVTVTDNITAGCTAMASVTVVDGPESVQEFESTLLNVYPNPNNGQFTCELDGNGRYTVTVLNLIGQTVHREVINAQGKYVSSIDLKYVDAGIYFFNVRSDSYESTTKVLIH